MRDYLCNSNRMERAISQIQDSIDRVKSWKGSTGRQNTLGSKTLQETQALRQLFLARNSPKNCIGMIGRTSCSIEEISQEDGYTLIVKTWYRLQLLSRKLIGWNDNTKYKGHWQVKRTWALLRITLYMPNYSLVGASDKITWKKSALWNILYYEISM